MISITWLGRAAFKITTSDKCILIDPWIKGNKTSPLKSYKDINKADIVLVTHDHGDHGYKDAVKICRRTGATFVGVFELANKARWSFVRKAVGSNIGGEIEVNGIKIYFTPALHSSKIAAPCGFIIKIGNRHLYHTGDTGFFSDMEYLKKLYPIDILILPICREYMMGPKEALWSVEKIKPQIVIPCHFDSSDKEKNNLIEFVNLAQEMAKIEILKQGETLSFND